MDARAGMGATDEQQELEELATSPWPSVPEQLVSPGAAPVRCLPIGASAIRRRRPFPSLGAPLPRGCRRNRRPRTGSTAIRDWRLLLTVELPARAGMRYRFRLDRGEAALPDPASRFQPEGPHGPSEIVDPGKFAWTTGRGRVGARAARHIRDACRHLHARWNLEPLRVSYRLSRNSVSSVSKLCPWRTSRAVRLGIRRRQSLCTNQALRPTDGFSPLRRPRPCSRDRRHPRRRLQPFRPGRKLSQIFSAAYFTDRYDNEWGEAINFDGPDAGPTREFFVANAGY